MEIKRAPFSSNTRCVKPLLTNRQIEIMDLMTIKYLSVKQVANALCIQISSVHSQLNKVKDAYDTNNMTEACLRYQKETLEFTYKLELEIVPFNPENIFLNPSTT